MGDHASAVGQFIEAAQRFTAGSWTRALAPGKWSPAEITSHVAEAYEILRGELGGGPGMRLLGSPLRRWLLRQTILPRILWGWPFPAGARAPREIRPREIPDDPAIALAALAAGADAFARDLSARAADRRLRLSHAYFGPMSAASEPSTGNGAHAASRTSARGSSSVRMLDDVFAGLNRSAFRRKFHFRAREQAYLRDRGLDTVLEHARRFVAERLAPASPRNDGKQTPYRGHPVFIAQHATACCCRSCLEKFHGIARGHALTPAQHDYVIAVLERWLRAEEAKFEWPI